jgi:SAM-dependent methyltransferase
MSTANSLSEWFAMPQGRYLMEREQAFFDGAVADIFGFNAVQLGLPKHELLRSSRMPLRFKAGKEFGAEVWLEEVELPFETGSLDLVVLPHVLEFSTHPHHILREVERVLRPEGSVIISGFNPRSMWGMRRVLGSKAGYPWNGRFISLTRMKDWMALLGFEVEGGSFTGFAPPFTQTAWLSRCSFLEPAGDRWWAVFGGVYFLHAIKRVPGMRLIKPKWNARLVKNLLPASPKLNRELTQKSQKQ